MRTKLAIVFVALLAVPVAGAAVGIKATLKTPAANPEINVKWWYSIKVTNLAGKPVNARLTANVIDPFGGVHPMDYGPTGPPNPGPPKPIKNRLIRGGFRDFLLFPPESRGFKLTLRWVVKAKIGEKTYRKVLKRVVTPG
jgi:hypothetical protein